MKALALIQTGPGAHVIDELPIPDPENDSAILRVEANGMCGSDITLYAGGDPAFAPGDTTRFPRIPGHEIVGRIERAGADFLAARGLREGDRVALNPFLPCGQCAACRRGEGQMCVSSMFVPPEYGSLPMRIAPGLWGGYATHVYVHPKAITYKLSDSIDAADATVWNALAGGVQWAVLTPQLQIGQSVVVLGAGQRGLTSVAAARHAGAGLIITTGLSQDRHKLDLALELGADRAVDVEREDIVSTVDELTGGEGVDLVIDTTPTVTTTIDEAVKMLRRGGKLVNIGLKPRYMDHFPIGWITTKSISVIGANGQTDAAHRRAVDLISSGVLGVEKMRTHTFHLDEFELALDTLAGKVPGEDAINVVLTPTPSSGR